MWDIDLISISGDDVEIESFEFTSSTSPSPISQAKLDGSEIWSGNASFPTGVLTLNSGSSSARTIAAGTTDTLWFQNTDDPSGNESYTLVVNFTDGSSSTINFSISW